MLPTLQLMRARLRPKYGRGEADAMIRLIFHHLKGWSATDMIIHEGDALSAYTVGEINRILDRLDRDEPIQYVLGETRFCGLDLKVAPGVLIPRPETAELVDMVVSDCGDRPDLDVLDLCTGSGAIALALARHLRFPRVQALELSEKALEIARENARLLKVQVRFIHADIFSWEPPAESLDVIVSNPPYVCESEKAGMEPNVLLHEPREALFVPDSDPFVYYRRIAEIARRGLRPGGLLYLEINPRFAGEIREMLLPAASVEAVRDIHGRERFIKALWNAES